MERAYAGLVISQGEKWYSLDLIYQGHTGYQIVDARTISGVIGDSIKEAIVDLSVLDLVSVSENYDRYGLDENSQVEIIAKKEDKVVRGFFVGNRASPFNYTYIKLQGDSRVFHAEGYLQLIFQQAKEEYIDKQVLSFEKEEIEQIVLAREDGSLRLVKSTGSSSDKNDEPKVYWTASTGDVRDNEKVDPILLNLSDLICFEYRQEDPVRGQSLVTVILSGEKEYRLEVFNQEGDLYPATSSESAFPFVLSSWIVDVILELVEG